MSLLFVRNLLTRLCRQVSDSDCDRPLTKLQYEGVPGAGSATQ